MRGEKVLVSTPGQSSLSHSNTLLRDINNTLKAGAVSLSQIELLAVALGPGSFTGLRIGLASIKALSATLETPCLGVPTLHAVALAAGPSKSTVALLPAGRGELFAQLLSVSADSKIIELDLPAHLAPGRVADKYAAIKDLIWAGAGAHAQKEFLREQAQQRGYRLDESGVATHGWRLAPTSENMAIQIALIAGRQSERAGLAEDLHAMYVRPSDPELRNVGK